MKKLLFLLALIPSVALAQPIAIYQPPTPIAKLSTTPGAPGQAVSGFATNEFLQIQTINAGNAPGTTENVNSGIVVTTPVANATPGASSQLAVNQFRAQEVSVDSNFQSSQALGLLKLEDSPAADGDAGVVGLWRRNDTGTSTVSANGDYIVPSSNVVGAIEVDVNTTFSSGAAGGILKPNTTTWGSGDAGVANLERIDTNGTTSYTNGRYGSPVIDENGKSAITYSAPGQSFQSCSAAAAGIVDVAIKTAVASNRIYVTSLSCTNTSSAVSTLFVIDDGATQIWQGYLASTTLGEAQWSQSFPVPLRGSVATALNVKPATTASSTICCAAGYISTL